MRINFREAILQLRAVVKICFLRPNTWREIVLGLMILVLAPLVIFICLMANVESKK